MNCSIDGCARCAFRSGLCATHYKRKQRNKDLAAPVREYGMTQLQRIAKAALRYANAEDADENEYRRAAKRLLEAKLK